MSKALIAQWSRLEKDYERRLKATRSALEEAQAAIWDAHYGHGLALAYVHSVDRSIRKALAEVAR